MAGSPESHDEHGLILMRKCEDSLVSKRGVLASIAFLYYVIWEPSENSGQAALLQQDLASY
jgi:hypothetical protein